MLISLGRIELQPASQALLSLVTEVSKCMTCIAAWTPESVLPEQIVFTPSSATLDKDSSSFS